MLNKHLKIVATILAILSFPPSMNADGDKQTPVPTHRRIPPKLDGNMKPHKAPGLQTSPVQIYYDTESGELIIENPGEISGSYYIENEQGVVVWSSVFSESYHADCLNSLSPGQYLLVIECDGVAYEGNLDIE